MYFLVDAATRVPVIDSWKGRNRPAFYHSWPPECRNKSLWFFLPRNLLLNCVSSKKTPHLIKQMRRHHSFLLRRIPTPVLSGSGSKGKLLSRLPTPLAAYAF
jgi:hypothetical protein